MNQLDEELEALRAMPPAALRAEWHKLYRNPAPRLGPDALRRGLAWKLQTRVHGGLPTSTRRSIEAALRQLEKTGQVTADTVRLKPGTRLVRRWHGKTYHVLVLDNGFEHESRRYVSLSQIARAITGAQWSGPRFFGLRKGATHG